jgi:hypothetical protein
MGPTQLASREPISHRVFHRQVFHTQVFHSQVFHSQVSTDKRSSFDCRHRCPQFRQSLSLRLERFVPQMFRPRKGLAGS